MFQPERGPQQVRGRRTFAGGYFVYVAVFGGFYLFDGFLGGASVSGGHYPGPSPSLCLVGTGVCYEVL